MKRFLTLVAVFALAWSVVPVASAETASLPQLEDEVMCPVCGTLLGLSRAPAAERQRVFIRKMINEGATEDEVKDALVAEYGPQVLALPDDDGINVYAYMVPLVGFALGALGVLYAGIRWRRNKKQATPAADGPPQGESDRLDEDMAKYDL